MSDQTELCEEYESVDLTEDEQSSEENFDESSPINFVDCSSTEVSICSTVTTTSPPPLIAIKETASPQYPKPTLRYKNIPNIIKKYNTVSSESTLTQRKMGKLSTVSTLAETQDILAVDRSKTLGNVCIESDEGKTSEENAQNFLIKHQITNEAQNQTIYSQKQPGKVVIIKKNNKYYKIVIPHNVMPNINKSTGPVLINIPEVGPLVISNDPEVTKSNSTPEGQPFSLNLDDQQSKLKDPPPLVKRTRKIPEVSAKEAALSDKKFCWTFSKGKKRDLEGFTYADRLGFNHAESQRAKKCSRVLDSIVSKKRTQLINQMYNFNKFKESVNTENKVKLIKINAIVGKNSKEKSVIASKFAPDEDVLHSPVPKYSKRKNVSEMHQVHDDNEVKQDANYDCDLLLTKKVVILNGGDKKIVTKKKRSNITKKLIGQKRKSDKVKIKRIWTRKFAQHKKTFANNKSFVLKPCYVHMVREESVEEAYRKFSRDMKFNHKQKAVVSVDNKANAEFQGKSRRNSNVVNFKPTITPKKFKSKNYADVETDPREMAFLNNTVKTFNARVIETTEQFKNEINYLKPILIVNEHNLSIINYSSQFYTSNIIYIVKENRHYPLNVIRNANFISAFELGFLKLVDAQLFCKYLMKSDGFYAPENDEYISDHSYCMS